MKLEILNLNPWSFEGTTLASASVCFDNSLTVHGIRLCETEKGRFIGMPSIKKSKDGKDVYEQICKITDGATYKKLLEAMIKRYDTQSRSSR